MTTTEDQLVVLTEQELAPLYTRKTVQLDENQLKAVAGCCDMSNRIVAVTGAAGSGKTTIFEEVYHKLRDAGYTIGICTTAGKAAKRIKEVTGLDAMTIKRFLEFTHPGDPDPKTGKPIGFSLPRRNRQNRLEVDVILADEYAMVNWEDHRAIFDAMPNGGCIRVFGDNNQLPPIEETDWRDKDKVPEPSPFETLLNKFSAFTLDTVYRQGKDSGILMNLQNLLRGRMPTRNDQWTMNFTDRPVDALTDYVMESLDKGVSFATPDNQIITTQKRSWVGTEKLNTLLQGLFKDETAHMVHVPRNKWENDGIPIPMFKGDKVIITRNMYDLDVMNGETGIIIDIGSDGELVIDFGDKEQVIPPVLMVLNRYGKHVEIDPRKDVALGYVITTHKSQGSEYSRVVYMLNKSTSYMQNRRNFYTATSRGREHVMLISDQASLRTSLYKRG